MGESVTTVAWFRHLAEKGGKGVVNNIDARALGRIADDLEAKDAEVARLKNVAFQAQEMAKEIAVRLTAEIASLRVAASQDAEAIVAAGRLLNEAWATIARLQEALAAAANP